MTKKKGLNKTAESPFLTTGGADETRTRDLRRDRPFFIISATPSPIRLIPSNAPSLKGNKTLHFT